MKVSVIMITYNHAKYIEQAINGVLLQETNFDVELIIANDCSTDNSDYVIKTLLSQHENFIDIKYYNHEKNEGVQPNFIFAYNKCKGKYVALCEGDDYWTDPFKLQKQVDFLDKNSHYSYCSHQSMLLNKGVLEQKSIRIGDTNLEDVINGNNLNTATLLFRKKAIDQPFPDFFEKVHAGDWILQLMALKNGKAYVLEDTMSVYRKHDNSIWSSLNSKEMGQLGIDTLIKAKQLFKNDRFILKLINNAIKERAIKFSLRHGTFWTRIRKIKFLRKYYLSK